PSPFVFERQQLVHVGAAIDHRLVVHRNAAASAVDAGFFSGGYGMGPVEGHHLLLGPAHWQASQSGSSMRQAGPSSAGMTSVGLVEVGATGTGVTATELSLPSVPLRVDFSTWVAERERR